MTNLILKPLTCAAVLGILLEAGCGGTINLTKQNDSAGSGATPSGGTGSLLSGGSGALSSSGGSDLGAGGRGEGGSPGNAGGAGNRGGAPSVTAGASNACGRDGNPCGIGDGMTCVVRNADVGNCGTCGNACSSGQLCFAGVCASPPAACGTDSVVALRPPLASGSFPKALVIGDWNGDGMTDLAAANSNDGTVSVFLGCGSGTFAPRADYVVTTPVAPDQFPMVKLTSCDVNADGKADLVTAGYADHAVTVLLGAGDGTFVVVGTSQFTDIIGAIACADLSGDGNGDVAVCGNNSYGLSVLLSVGDGTLKPRIDFPTTTFSADVAVGDLNEDGKADLVTGNAGRVVAILGNGDGTFRQLPEQTNSVAPDTNDFAVADLNGDGHLDLGMGDSQPRGGPKGGLGIIAGKGDGTFANLVQLPPANDTYGVAVGDVNSDGRPDLVGASQSGIRVVFGTVGGGTAEEASLGLAITGYYATEELGDINGDGKLDLLFTKGSDNQVYLLVGNGDGTFRE